MKIRAFSAEDESAVIELWNRAGLTRPWNDPAADIRRKLSVQPEWFLVGEVDKKIVASVMAGYDGHRGWLNYLAVAPDHRRHGYARELVDHATTLLQQAGCPKINLQIRAGNSEAIAFYQAVGFGEDAVVSFGKRLIQDETLLYKILSRTDWQEAQGCGVFSGCGIDLKDGFIHLSTEAQVRETARLYFANQDDLLLLTVAAVNLGGSLRWEASRNGQHFPHVYGTIPLESVIHVDPLDLQDDGTHRFPPTFGR